MKRTLALILAMLLSLSMLAGCGQQQSGTPATEAPAEEEAPAEVEAPKAEETVEETAAEEKTEE